MGKIKLLLTGDSTMADYESEKYPGMGWGQALPRFFTEEVEVINHAMSGRSTKSFIAEGRWGELEKQITRDDFVVIQFGHNDQKFDKERSTSPFSSYQSNLRYFIERTRAFEATPILLTSIARRHFDENGNLLETHGEYPEAVRQLAEKLNVLCID